MNRKWNNREIEQQAKELQKAADNNNMKPLWNYQKTPQKIKQHSKNASLYTENGEETNDTTQTILRWTQWIQQHFSQTNKECSNIEIDHIPETIWEEIEKQKT